MKRDLYATVSARIVAELERGAAPWIKPWSAMPGASTPCNAVSNRPYSGCNVVLLWMAQAANCRHSSAKPPCGSTTKQLYCSSLDGRFIQERCQKVERPFGGSSTFRCINQAPALRGNSSIHGFAGRWWFKLRASFAALLPFRSVLILHNLLRHLGRLRGRRCADDR
jgi:hypothetical protein